MLQVVGLFRASIPRLNVALVIETPRLLLEVHLDPVVKTGNFAVLLGLGLGLGVRGKGSGLGLGYLLLAHKHVLKATGVIRSFAAVELEPDLQQLLLELLRVLARLAFIEMDTKGKGTGTGTGTGKG